MDKGLNLLLVEDSASDAKLTETYLIEAFLGACTVVRERTLEGGLAQLQAGGIDAVILDLGLPDSSGLDTFRQVAALDSHVPVVILSGMSDAKVAAEAVALGAQEYVLKDEATPRELARAVGFAISRQRLLDNLEAATRAQLEAKDRFVSSVSHELRTPLAAVYQFVSLVADGTAGPVNEEQQDFLDTSMRNIGQLRRMIDDLLTASRLQSHRGVGSLRPQRLSVTSLIEDSVSTLDAPARQKSIHFEIRAPSLPDAWCDPDRTSEVLNNLLDNAIKFSPAGGGVVVGAAVSGDQTLLQISVEDSGPGVHPENRERVFEQFFQEGDNDESGRAGLGLGLYICRQIVERQGGHIWIEALAASSGAQFVFTLPISPATDLVEAK